MTGTRPSTSILCVVGARPNFMKIAPIVRAFGRQSSGVSASLLHTGQHYDDDMKRSLFEQLSIPEPDIDPGLPCITLRENTERPITVSEGTNTITGVDDALIHAAFEQTLAGQGKTGLIPEFWDGKAVERIADHVQSWLKRIQAA